MTSFFEQVYRYPTNEACLDFTLSVNAECQAKKLQVETSDFKSLASFAPGRWDALITSPINHREPTVFLAFAIIAKIKRHSRDMKQLKHLTLFTGFL